MGPHIVRICIGDGVAGTFHVSQGDCNYVCSRSSLDMCNWYGECIGEGSWFRGCTAHYYEVIVH